MKFHVVTLFRECFSSLLATSLLGKAVESGLVSIDFIDPRDFTSDRHRTVDDTPFGGGEGMVMKPEPLVAAIESAGAGDPRPHRVLLTPQGERLGQRHLTRLSREERVVLVCGRYEGIDERVRGFVDQELSLGDFVLNGGEVAAMAVIDGVARLLPGVIGNQRSLEDESHAAGLLEYPQYTRPRTFRGAEVPEVLLGGDHEAIRRWRRIQMLQRTRERRPDLWATFRPAAEDLDLLAKDPDPWSPGALAARTFIALLHHPVYDRSGAVVTSAITNLDLHDISRSARTYGLAGYLVVTPLNSQQELARRIAAHWQTGYGATYNQRRREALSLLEVARDLEEARALIETRTGRRPLIVSTSAVPRAGQITQKELRSRLPAEQPLLLLLGTGWGLTEEVLGAADLALAPVWGPSSYNHLSVRSAAAILLDRCFGLREENALPSAEGPSVISGVKP